MNKQWAALGALVMLAPVYGQLYLVAGSQTPKSPVAFSSELFKVGDGGRLQHVAEIASKESGLFWLETSSEARKLVALTRTPFSGSERSSMVVVGFDEGAITKTCPLPPGPENYMGIEEWLTNIPVKGLALMQLHVPLDPVGGKREVLRGVLVDPALSCQSSAETVAPTDSTAIVLSGGAGVAGTATNEPVVIGMDSDGRIVWRLRGGNIVYFGYQVPESLRSGMENPGFSVMINTSRVLAVVVGGGPPDKVLRLLAFRKSDQTWHRVPNPSDRYPWARSFEHYIAIPEAREKSLTFPESAGSAEWRKEGSEMGPSIAGAFAESPVAYPGRLHLYDIDSERVFTIDTKQGDSEVLLIENGTVYYRASDRLYSASITDKGIGAARLIATDEAVRDTHWAFVKR